MALLYRLLGRKAQKAKEGVSEVLQDMRSENTRNGFVQNAINTVFNKPVIMYDKSTTINCIDQGKPLLAALSQAMAKGADVDSSARRPPPRCYPGTRITLTTKTQNWLLDDKRMWDLLWLHGPAGVGKSAVAQTVAEFAKENHRMGVAFFFAKTNGHNNPHFVFITLAYQLAVRLPGYLPFVAKQLAADPDLLDKAPHVQFRQLIIEPLGSLSAQQKYLIILDGLDECNGEQAQLDIVELINDLIQSQTSVPVVWMISSRPELHLKRAFSRVDFAIRCWGEELVIDTEEARGDTARFIHARFKEIHENYSDCVNEGPDGSWPPEDDATCIINEASELFVFTSTILKCIENPLSGNPDACLAEALALIQHSRIVGARSPMESLDLLYTRILSEVPDNIWPTTHRLLKVSIESVSRVEENTPWLLSNFLGITRGDFYTALRKLHSVLDVPPPEEADERPLRFFHASFRDYLVQPGRSGRFCVTQPPDFKCHDEIQKSSLRLSASPTIFMSHCLSVIESPLSQAQVDGALNQTLTWPSAEPKSNRDIAFRLTSIAHSNMFWSYSKLRAHGHNHQELENMLCALDFNVLPYMKHSYDEIMSSCREFILWIRGTAIRDLLRTHSTSEVDDKLLSYLEGQVDVAPMDFDLFFTNPSFLGQPLPVYLLLGYSTNAILAVIDSEGGYIQYHSLKSPSEIWPSLAGLIDEQHDVPLQSYQPSRDETDSELRSQNPWQE